jgi:hypothetical protein
LGQVLKKQKGTYGFYNVGYRHVDGQIFPALITGSTALGTPGVPTVTVVGAAGAVTYSYRITAITVQGETVAGTAGTTATGNATLSGANFNRVSWSAVSGATGYRVYGRSTGTELLMATVQVTVPGGTTKVGGGTINGTGAGDGFEDTGAVTPSGALPGAGSAFLYSVRVPSLRQGPSGGTNWVKANLPILSIRSQSNGVVVGR